MIESTPIEVLTHHVERLHSERLCAEFELNYHYCDMLDKQIRKFEKSIIELKNIEIKI